MITVRIENALRPSKEAMDRAGSGDPDTVPLTGECLSVDVLFNLSKLIGVVPGVLIV